MPDQDSIEQFLARWQDSGGSERSNFQSFAHELCELLDVDVPKPSTSDGSHDDYRFERPVTFQHTHSQSRGSIDLYKKGCFVLEAKQGTSRLPPEDANQLALLTEEPASRGQKGHGKRNTSGFDSLMIKAKEQADNYARAVSKEDGWPPFLLVVDVGHTIEVYADFSRQGHGYHQFPDRRRYKIALGDLRREETRQQLRAIWTDPWSLDPALAAARVTRKIAGHLAALGNSLENNGHDSEKVARFLMRCLFTMFAEDVRLIPKGSFTDTLTELRGHPEHAAPTLQSLWQTMNAGGFSIVLKRDVMRFNGGLFADSDALPLDNVQLGLLIEAAQADWQQVEPAIFGTLLERALDKRQRHKLGAHYTPRAYVERLVAPTIMEPLRDDWKNVKTSVLTLEQQGKTGDAIDQVKTFHQKLCNIHILDPACGSGNFLYVTMEQMKKLEGEVTEMIAELGEKQEALGLSGMTVDPHQFLGIEINPWAAAVAELVLWIGYLQWHFRTYGQASPAEPVLRDFRNIECRDAVLTWSDRTPRLDEDGKPASRWDGITTMRHPVTGEDVPDPEARTPIYDYIQPQPAAWPEADFIIGNPPFIGASRLRESLGDGYAEALWQAYPKLPRSADFVMFWWHKAANATRIHARKKDVRNTRRFGLITTNSLRQTFNRRIVEPHLGDPKKPLSLLFAIPDHPWVDSADGAAVRIAMTVGRQGRHIGQLLRLSSEDEEETEAEGRKVTFDHQIGKIFANLHIGADVTSTVPLKSNMNLAYRGMQLIGSGFIVSTAKAAELGLGKIDGLEQHIRHYRNGRDLMASPRNVMVIDLFGLTEHEVRTRFPEVFQHVLDTVKPDRDQNNRESYKQNWWIHGEPRKDLRPALEGLPRYIATVETTKHRVFTFLDASILPDNMLIAMGLHTEDKLALLSSRAHVTWALAAGGTLEDRPRYNKSRCFDPFPFPDPTDAQRAELRTLGESLDAHRKRQQAEHPTLTLTQMYNVLEKLRAGEVIEGKDRLIYDQGLVGMLKELHDRIDAAVAAAYGWPVDLSDEEILHRLVALNRERAAEEARGHVRWLRPDFQNPSGQQVAKNEQYESGLVSEVAIEKALWPATMPEQIAAVRDVLEERGEASAEEIARAFKRVRVSTIRPLLASLVAVGRAHDLENDRFAA